MRQTSILHIVKDPFTLFYNIVILLLLSACSNSTLAESQLIRSNQSSFYPLEEKIAVLVTDGSETRTSVFSDRKTAVLSFTDLTIPGESIKLKYRIRAIIPESG